MKKIIWIFAGVLVTQTACDLQPKIVSLPDSVGEFISARYPALLADPNTQPEIYNSAATDYGVYASPDLYGSPATDEYVMYASVDDYIIPPQQTDIVADVDVGAEIVVAENTNQVAPSTDYLLVPMYGGGDASADVLSVRRPSAGVQGATKVELDEITVVAGDTLYSLSRKYAVPVNDLAVMNNLSAPFNLSVGQKLRVPKLARVAVKPETDTTVKKVDTAQPAKTEVEKTVVATKPAEKKISSDPKKKLPSISARSSSKFSWPVRGKILSAYGAKSNGLFNDGINISAAQGAAVKAAENGVVAYAGNEVKGMGNLIIIQHTDGWMTVYAHMDSMTVRRGTKVTVGQKIGTVGKTGKVDSPQLHFEIRKGTKAYNPSSYLKN